MTDERWRVTCVRPRGLVPAVRIDPSGRHGPTRGGARSARWVRVSHGWYVDSSRRPDVVEQRILEQAARLPDHGAVTAWAALRWRGGGFFSGTDDGGRTVARVPLVVGPGSNMRSTLGSVLSWEQLAPYERELVDGLACTTTHRATFDEIRRRNSIRAGVVAADMSIAAGLATVEGLARYAITRSAWTGVPLVRKVMPLVRAGSESPQETLLRLAWVLDAELPPPLVNPRVVGPDGVLLGRPDLLDPGVGLVGEYDGADHLREDRRRHDRIREERFRDHGLEVVTVVRGELTQGDRVAQRLRAAHLRAGSTARRQTWSLAG